MNTTYRIIDLRQDVDPAIDQGIEARPYLLTGDQRLFPTHERYETLGAARVRVIMLQRADAQNHL